MKKESNEVRNFTGMTEEEAKAVIFKEGYNSIKKGTVIGFVKQFHGEEPRDWFKGAYEYKDEYVLEYNEEAGKKKKVSTGKKSNRATYNNAKGRKLFWEHFGLDKLRKEEEPLSIEEAMERDWAC